MQQTPIIGTHQKNYSKSKVGPSSTWHQPTEFEPCASWYVRKNNETCAASSYHKDLPKYYPENKVDPSSTHPPSLNPVQSSTSEKSKKLVQRTLTTTPKKITQKILSWIKLHPPSEFEPHAT